MCSRTELILVTTISPAIKYVKYSLKCSRVDLPSLCSVKGCTIKLQLISGWNNVKVFHSSPIRELNPLNLAQNVFTTQFFFGRPKSSSIKSCVEIWLFNGDVFLHIHGLDNQFFEFKCKSGSNRKLKTAHSNKTTQSLKNSMPIARKCEWRADLQEDMLVGTPRNSTLRLI